MCRINGNHKMSMELNLVLFLNIYYIFESYYFISYFFYKRQGRFLVKLKVKWAGIIYRRATLNQY
jgi:hypothetical protein